MSDQDFPAKIFYVVGASGSGKDSLIRYFRDHLSEATPKTLTAHRYITRQDSQNEDSIYLTEKEFSERNQHALFSLAWRANGLHYGIGVELDHWLGMGFSVIVNGSREYLPTAKAKYGDSLHSVLIEVPEAILKQRLETRARESSSAIESRLARHRKLNQLIPCDSRVMNTASIAEGAEKFRYIIHSNRQPGIGCARQTGTKPR